MIVFVGYHNKKSTHIPKRTMIVSDLFFWDPGYQMNKSRHIPKRTMIVSDLPSWDLGLSYE